MTQIIDAVKFVVTNALEWILSTIAQVTSFMFSHYINALAHGEPWALVIAVVVIVPAAVGMLGGSTTTSTKWCGTCGAKGHRHEDWCRRGRWGGRQKWRQD